MSQGKIQSWGLWVYLIWNVNQTLSYFEKGLLRDTAMVIGITVV